MRREMSEANENPCATDKDTTKCNGERTDDDKSERVNEVLDNDEKEEEDDDDEHYWFPGQTACITGLTDRTEMNGRYGYVVETESEDGKITVRVNFSRFRTETVRLERCNLQFVPEDDEPRIEVIWLYTRRLNTGQRGGIAEVMADAYVSVGEDESSVCQISCTETELHEFISRMQFDHVPTPLLDRMGLHLACYARPHTGSAEGNNGRDNVLASYIATSISDQRELKPTSIVGTAFLVRFSPSTGEVVDFSHDEIMRLLMFVNDVKDIRQGEQEVFTDDVLDTFATCLPFYDVGCRMTLEGFVGLRSMQRLEDGAYAKDPEDMLPVSTHPM